ncbi:hypothetical protein GGTG_11997 [Gaeumannomyces tritici R3-111a-1]|uniref:Uncharacterized protein n=1 Tax=Gaeumannomyces tritici (strain R3-111a-1) TaxID=644352 RepID=J3PER7_GAET3|nr:hypothetical protein GGTG_11997 [Gaeumannomyces tritici R3-111a-1]EJT70975.1 hypothetical protein GGTG_11997 [Gaeumannomyces tritici R3-111a-1]
MPDPALDFLFRCSRFLRRLQSQSPTSPHRRGGPPPSVGKMRNLIMMDVVDLGNTGIIQILLVLCHMPPSSEKGLAVCQPVACAFLQAVGQAAHRPVTLWLVGGIALVTARSVPAHPIQPKSLCRRLAEDGRLISSPRPKTQ